MVKMYYSNIIEIDIWSKFGCFIKPFSNSGGLLTYLIPPKTTIIGMMGAVLGYNFNDYTMINGEKHFVIEKLNDVKISIQPLFSLKVKRTIYNNQNSINKLINIKQDILINPYYKLYISFPNRLKEEEKWFNKRIKNNQSVYNLYMGKNEFLLNFKYCGCYKNVDYFSLSNINRNAFFKSSNEIHGSLNRINIHKSVLSKKTNSPVNLFSVDNSYNLESYYEYLITDYPIKREEFVEFIYEPISFYSRKKNEKCFFSDIELLPDKSLDLFSIGDKKWISLI